MKTTKRIISVLVVTTWFVTLLHARAKTSSDHFVYLPIIVNPPLTVADFDTCDKINNLGGEMGAAYEPSTSDRLTESYEPEVGRGCVARLDYKVPTGWSAFWLKLLHLDLTQHRRLSFDINFIGQIDTSTDMEIKVELKRDCHDQMCDEAWIQYVPGITDEWQTMTINLADFYSLPDKLPPPSLTGIEELVFTFEKDHISSEGLVYLDNIVFEP